MIVVRKAVNYSKQNYKLSGERDLRGNRRMNFGSYIYVPGKAQSVRTVIVCHTGRVIERNGTQECSIKTQHPILE
jgi:hypothetical protein